MAEGKVKWFNEVKGYGFIEYDAGRDLFIHKSNVTEGTKLQEGMQVRFDVQDGQKGPCAVDVKGL